MSLFGELRRRSVFKVGTAYAIVAWSLIQIADVLLPAFGAPEWVLPVFSVMIVLGFPVAVLLAWAYEVTPDGVRADSGALMSQVRLKSMCDLILI